MLFYVTCNAGSIMSCEKFIEHFIVVATLRYFFLDQKIISPVYGSDDSIIGFQFRYDIDTILTKYRDIDTISIFCKCVRCTSARKVTRHEQGSMLYLDKKCVFE